MTVSGTGYRSLGTGIVRVRYRMTVRTTIGEPYLGIMRIVLGRLLGNIPMPEIKRWELEDHALPMSFCVSCYS